MRRSLPNIPSFLFSMPRRESSFATPSHRWSGLLHTSYEYATLVCAVHTYSIGGSKQRNRRAESGGCLCVVVRLCLDAPAAAIGFRVCVDSKSFERSNPI